MSKKNAIVGKILLSNPLLYKCFDIKG